MILIAKFDPRRKIFLYFSDTHLPAGKGKILHTFMLATHSSLTAKENVAVMQFMESEILKLAERKGFTGIFTTNTSPVTQVNNFWLIIFCCFELVIAHIIFNM